MRILIINTDYPEFLASFYEDENLFALGYDEQLLARNKSLFGVADYYSKNFKALGHEAWEVHANNEILQKQWACENQYNIKPLTKNTYRKNIYNHFFSRVKQRLLRAAKQSDRDWMKDILEAQVKKIKPDIILNQAMETFSGSDMNIIRGNTQALIGQIASPLPENQEHYKGYDLIISSLPNFVEYFNSLGLKSSLSRLAFESSILSDISESEKTIEVGFFGSVTLKHSDRLALMEKLIPAVDLKIWGNIDKKILGKDSLLRKNCHSPLWGIEMYRMMKKTKIIVNHHIEIAENYANNMRLYEASGMGCLLVTDWKSNLAEIFEPEKEVVTYQTAEECVEKINYYLKHDKERAKIALAGQKRCLSEHTYRHRAVELMQTFSNILCV